MRQIAAALILSLALAACSDGARQLAQPKGPVFRLNPEAMAAAEPAR